jgi:hypothetical protein
MTNINADSATRRPLLGLLSYSYLSAKNGLTIIFGFAALMGIAYLVGVWHWGAAEAGFGPIAMIYSLLGLILMAGPVLSVLSADQGSGWARYRAAMPITREQLVAAKFIPPLVVTGAATVLWLLTIGANYILNVEQFYARDEVGQWVATGTMVVVAPLLTTAFAVPFSTTMRRKGGEIALILTCLIASFAGSQFLFAFFNTFIMHGANMYLILLVTIATSLGLVLASYLITRYLYAHTSF